MYINLQGFNMVWISVADARRKFIMLKKCLELELSGHGINLVINAIDAVNVLIRYQYKRMKEKSIAALVITNIILSEGSFKNG